MSEDLLGALMRDSLDHCVKCTICETYCPVANVTPLFPGPKYVGPQGERFRVADEPSPDASLDYCSGCGICTQVCPQGVHIAEINTQARAKLEQRQGRPAARPDPRAPDARRAGSARRSRRWPTGRCRNRVARLRGGEDDRPAPRRGDAEVRRAHVPGAGRRSTSPAPHARKVAYFHGCGANYYEPRLGEMTVELLEHNGVAVEVPRSRTAAGCRCSPTACSTTRAQYVHRLAARLAPYARAGHRHRRHVDELHADAQARGAGDPRARATTRSCARSPQRVYDICEYLLAMHDRGELKTDFRPIAGDRHLPRAVPAAGPRDRQAGARAAGAGARSCRSSRATLELLRHRRDLRAQAREVRDRDGRRRRAVRADRRQRLRPSAVCDSETCRWHIAHATGKPSVHPVEILYRASGLAEDGDGRPRHRLA